MLRLGVLLSALALIALHSPAAEPPNQAPAASSDPKPYSGESEGASKDQKFAYLSAVDLSRGQPALVYEICNRGKVNLAYGWEQFLLNSILKPQRPTTCDRARLEGPGQWRTASSDIALPSGWTKLPSTYWAQGQYPAPAGTFTSKIYKALVDANEATLPTERDLPDEVVTVEVVLKGEGPTEYYSVKWEESVGSLILELAKYSQATREALVKDFHAKANKLPNQVEIVSGAALMSRVKIAKEDAKRAQEFLRLKGSSDEAFILIRSSAKYAREVQYELLNPAKEKLIQYRSVLALDKDGAIVQGFRYVTTSDTK
ncbi:hypothetical protein ACFQ2A_04295 [Variovorax dokdonensis]|uniref:hypothetical protein n=1 Tax=Variovorax dokdonensis TaxID=344883 RepID=UPI0036255108